jgi:hypothetical protein
MVDIKVDPTTDTKTVAWTASQPLLCPCMAPGLRDFLFLFVLAVLVYETQGLMLARQELYHFSHSTSPFCVLGFFKIRSHKLFAWAGFKLQSS